jgi:hypothetical protein
MSVPIDSTHHGNLMQRDSGAALARLPVSPAAASARFMPRLLTVGFLGSMYLLLPVLPLVCGVVFLRWRYVRHYARTLRKLVIHLRALGEGPVQHYFEDVAGRGDDVPAEILGSCTQCGNCCLDKRCVFLEKGNDDRYLCGIFHSPLRRFSNCGSFPLHAHDIERYDCPGYTVVSEVPVQWIRRPDVSVRA